MPVLFFFTAASKFTIYFHGQFPALIPPPLSLSLLYWSHPRDSGVRLRPEGWTLHLPCNSQGNSTETTDRFPPDMWQTWALGAAASGRRRSSMQSALERVHWWWAHPQWGGTWRGEGGANTRMYNEGKNRALKQRGGLLSAVSNWLMSP